MTSHTSLYTTYTITLTTRRLPPSQSVQMCSSIRPPKVVCFLWCTFSAVFTGISHYHYGNFRTFHQMTLRVLYFPFTILNWEIRRTFLRLLWHCLKSQDTRTTLFWTCHLKPQLHEYMVCIELGIAVTAFCCLVYIWLSWCNCRQGQGDTPLSKGCVCCCFFFPLKLIFKLC